MGERKVIVNYIPPDFDPGLLPRMKRQRQRREDSRTMMPFTFRCNVCGDYTYMGTKCNAEKEMLPESEWYLGIRIFRFYTRCNTCRNEIVYKTDPQNADYILESGGKRNRDGWRENLKEIEDAKKEREKEEEQDAMKALENKTIDNKIEMDILDALDTVKALNQRHVKITSEKLLETLEKKNKKNNEENIEDYDQKEYDEFIKLKNNEKLNQNSSNVGEKVSFLDSISRSKSNNSSSSSTSSLNPLGLIVKKKKKVEEEKKDEKKDEKNDEVEKKEEEKIEKKEEIIKNEEKKEEISSISALGLLDYGDDDEDEN